MVKRAHLFFTLFSLLVLTSSCTGQGTKGGTQEHIVPNQMTLQSLHFQEWNTAYPLEISKQGQSEAFFQVAQVTFRLSRPSLELVGVEDELLAQNGAGKVIWKAEATVVSDPYDADQFEIDSFDEVLFVRGQQALVLESDNHLYLQEGANRKKDLYLRGVVCTKDGESYIAAMEGDQLILQSTKGDVIHLATGSEQAGQGPWNVYSVSADEILVANHHELRRYATDGSLLNESALTDEVYANELFPHAWHLASLAAVSLDEVRFAVTGPEGMAILALKW